MTPDEFKFWQKAYLAALLGSAAVPNSVEEVDCQYADEIARISVIDYRTAKATVVQGTD